MSTNKRYADKIDRRVEQRHQPPPTSSAPVWHPRANAYPNQWICRNGRWGTIYGAIEAEDVHRDMLWITVYSAWFISEGTRTPLGEFPTGDAASEALWGKFVERIEESGQTRSARGGFYPK